MNLSMLIGLLKAILLPIVGIFFATKYNIFEYITFIPKEYAFEAGITIYFAIIELICVWIEKWLMNKFFISIECIFYLDKNSKNINNTPEIGFSTDVSYINCIVSFSGNVKEIAKKEIMISLPNWVTAQVPNNSMWIVDMQNCLKLDLKKLVDNNGTNVADNKIETKFSVIRNVSGDSRSNTISPYVNGKVFMKFEYNKIIIRNSDI